MVPEDIVNHIISKVKAPADENGKDRPWWMLEAKGNFIVRSAWQYTRHKEQPNKIMKDVWVKGLPFKMAFLMWRLWKFKIPVDDRIRRWGYEGPSRCWCCPNPRQENMAHVFLQSETANRTWSYFLSFAGINIQNLTLREKLS